MLTGIYNRGQYDVILNSNYEIHKLVGVERGMGTNIHALRTTDNGTRSIAMTENTYLASTDELQEIGRADTCRIHTAGFEERDTETWELKFEWFAEKHIHFNETFTSPTCPGFWDYLHANSIDKFPDGDYLFGARHTDAIYKISAKDGSIVWRLVGKFSDFEDSNGVYFAGQHDAQVRSQNETHTVISLLDNANRPGGDAPQKLNEKSRGMIIALRTDVFPMTATMIAVYDHPYDSIAPGRGNMQVLANGNVFIGWWTGSLITEHSSDGRLLMQAKWLANVNSYRSYKFQWIGYPTQPPGVHAELVDEPIKAGNGSQSTQTMVWVSWNGATEVHKRNMYQTTPNGREKKWVASMQRQGFETKFVYNGVVRWVQVEGVDCQGKVLGESAIFKTIGSDIESWIETPSNTPQTMRSRFSEGLLLLSTLAVGAALALLLKTIRRPQRLQKQGEFAYLPKRS